MLVGGYEFTSVPLVPKRNSGRTKNKHFVLYWTFRRTKVTKCFGGDENLVRRKVVQIFF